MAAIRHRQPFQAVFAYIIPRRAAPPKQAPVAGEIMYKTAVCPARQASSRFANIWEVQT
jgi:hypothetical protein